MAGQQRMSRPLVLLMATATGTSVANNYYAQPLLPVMRTALHLSATAAGLIVTVAQVGYALGLLLVLPLGDLVERRRLVVVLSAGSVAALVLLGLAPNAPVLLGAALAVGVLSVLAQVLVPFAATLAADHERGRVVGLVMSGLLIGILLARTVAGAVAQGGTWRAVYFVAAAAMAVQALVLRARLPTYREPGSASYPALIRSVLTLLAQEPLLRLRAAYGCAGFATFSVLWTSLAFLLAARYHLGPALIGLFGLLGAAGALAATAAGRLADAGRERSSTAVAALLVTGAWLPLWLGAHQLGWLVVGILVLDVGTQGLHITNQSVIYRLRPQARSRLTAAYMVVYFIGGAAGSASSAALYAHAGWDGVSTLGAASAGVTVLLWLASARSR